MAKYLHSHIGSLPKSTSYLDFLKHIFCVSNVSCNFFTTSGLTYTWTEPSGAKIVSGQNTGKIIVNWESTGGNPTKNLTNLSFNADVEYRYSIVISDMSGKVVVRKSGIAKQGSNSIMIAVASLKDGLYNIAVINNDTNEKITTKLVKG